MSEAKACDFEFKHDTLKSILEELGKLNDATVTRPKVFQQLRDGLHEYCGDTYLDAFYGSRGSGRGFAGSILLLTKAGQNVSEEILKSTPWTSHHQDPHTGHSGQDCGGKYFNALQACLPKTFAALLFLFFNVSTECRKFGGGHWSGQKVNDSGNSFYHWLIGGSGSDGFIARKFSKEELHPSKTGQKVAQELKNAVSLKPSKTEGSLQNVLCGFLFVCKWDDALTGHACLFLHKFCEKVLEGSERLLQKPYKDHSEAFKDVCSALKSDLKPFIDGTSKLYAVCHGNTDLFKDLWDESKFLQYCEWLKGKLSEIINSLKAMSGESSAWSISKVPHAETAGPFRFGFVFKDSSWTSGSTFKSTLQEYISKLTGSDSGSLNSLLKCLNGDSTAISERLTTESTQSSSGAAAAGASVGVLSLGGAGFGAAYGFNLFGLKDIMSGVFGAIRGLVVGF
ncbi:secreted antigen 1 [Babesia divergens]|uniref:Secreted antigen 1 n=1 Tax=Babesia divergens TaxID=32595 RepID=A0AAD9GB25_BABDI|nr:secreted antigen 1 [Babesia divergens]